jgi:hypothetical protein
MKWQRLLSDRSLRRHSRPSARRLRLRPDDDDEPQPRAAGAIMPAGRRILIASNRGNVASGACGLAQR